MDVIRPAHDPQTLATLRRDPVVLSMAHGLNGVPRDELTHPDGTLHHAFMLAACDQYRARHGKYEGPLRMGAIGEALISLLDEPVRPDELYDGVPDAFLATAAERVAKRMRTNPEPGVVQLHAELLAEIDRRRAV